MAAGRTFWADPPPGKPARSLQSRLLDEPDIVDAVPEGGRVRLVKAQASAAAAEGAKSGANALAGVALDSAPARFEDAFMMLLRQAVGGGHLTADMDFDHVRATQGGKTIVEVHDLVRRFGEFVAVDHVSFQVQRGEIFGLLGPNGAGKTTTFRMLCGLLATSGGTLCVAGVDVAHARASARQRLGYVAQKFSLYGQLSVLENLNFFASAYGLRGRRRRDRIDWALRQFELSALARLPSGQLPGGYKQRLAMAAALLHEPEILFLDEPTSGADPLARREFWRRITTLAEQGVTVIITTHFMEEAEYCDRIAIMDAGRILAQGTPAEVRLRARPPEGKKPTMEDAFLTILEEARRAGDAQQVETQNAT
jgi:ABC-2 type transport system ATP-binding protein